MTRLRSAGTGAILSMAMLGVASVPAMAAPLGDVVEISAGQRHGCARLSSSRVRCWGDNIYGQVGDGSKNDRGKAVLVRNSTDTGPLTGVAKIAAGPQTVCALLTSRQLRCWGFNASGQLGDGTTEDRARPVTVLDATGTGPLRQVVAVAPGNDHTCALLESGRVRCWGDNSRGQLGDGTNDEHPLPVLVKNPTGSGPLTDVARIDAGLYHTCARLRSGEARCWGRDESGELGNGEPEIDSSLPVAVTRPSGAGNLAAVVSIDATEYYTCAALASGQARCWGYGGDGVLGNGSTDGSSRPVVTLDPSGTSPLGGVAAVEAGGDHSCALLATGRARCWGDDDNGQLGTGTPMDFSALPVIVRSAGGGQLGRIRQLAVGYGWTCARLASGLAKCWGVNSSGELGDGTFTESHVPVTVVR